MLRCSCCAVLAVLGAATSDQPKVCDVTEFGAKGDNATEDTEAVLRAVAACSGHTVVLPAGHTFLLRPIELPSSTTLVVDGNVAGWRDIESWPNSSSKRCPITPYQTPRAQVRTAPQKEDLIWSANASSVTIRGAGTIDGSGWRWWRKMHGPPPPGAPDYWHSCRPGLVAFGRRSPAYDSGVTDLRVEGITLKDSPFWTFTGRGLRGAVISRVHVTTTGCGYGEAPNTDGFNIQGDDIVIEHCTVRNGDDCVPIFPPTRNVTVTNISCECGNGLAPCIWPSMSVPGEGGDIKDILFDGASFKHTSQAVVIKSLPSFIGAAENITYRNFALDGVKTAVMINVYDQNRADGAAAAVAAAAAAGANAGAARAGLATGSEMPSASAILIENVTGTAVDAGKIVCGPGAAACHGIEMRGVRLDNTTTPYTCEHAGRVAAEGCSPKPCAAAP